MARRTEGAAAAPSRHGTCAAAIARHGARTAPTAKRCARAAAIARHGARAASTAKRCARAAPKGERGVALLLALMTMVLLTVVVVEFTFSTQVEYRRAQGWLAARRAALIAEAGIDLAGEVLAQDFRTGNTDSLSDLWAAELPPIDTGNGRLLVRISDEQGRFNLNRLSAGAASVDGRRLQLLLGALQLDTNLVAPLTDWIDRNQDTTGSAGAEDSYYAGLRPPYTARNGPLQSFAELGLVRGFNPLVLAKLRPVATVLPESVLKVNPNTAPVELLQALDARLADQFLVQRLIERRKVSPFTSVASLRAVDGMQEFTENELNRLFTFSSNYFRVRSTGDADGVFQSVEALVYRLDVRIQVLYLLARRGPNIVGADLSAPVPIDDVGRLGAKRL